tara:strand:- start:295 stop:1656 length:1362 start_codon:yes stop_codon:yes gene_type:complete
MEWEKMLKAPPPVFESGDEFEFTEEQVMKWWELQLPKLAKILNEIDKDDPAIILTGPTIEFTPKGQEEEMNPRGGKKHIGLWAKFITNRPIDRDSEIKLKKILRNQSPPFTVSTRSRSEEYAQSHPNAVEYFINVKDARVIREELGEQKTKEGYPPLKPDVARKPQQREDWIADAEQYDLLNENGIPDMKKYKQLMLDFSEQMGLLQEMTEWALKERRLREHFYGSTREDVLRHLPTFIQPAIKELINSNHFDRIYQNYVTDWNKVKNSFRNGFFVVALPEGMAKLNLDLAERKKKEEKESAEREAARQKHMEEWKARQSETEKIRREAALRNKEEEGKRQQIRRETAEEKRREEQRLKDLKAGSGERRAAASKSLRDRRRRRQQEQRQLRDEEKKSESWWDTLKDAGPVTTTNPGTKAMFNNKAINPPKKKPKKKKPKTYPIVPEEKDFWRD